MPSPHKPWKLKKKKDNSAENEVFELIFLNHWIIGAKHSLVIEIPVSVNEIIKRLSYLYTYLK